MNNVNILPGMLDDKVEFFNNKSKVLFLHKGRVRKLKKLPKIYKKIILKKIKSDLKVKIELERLYPNSETKQIKKFISCRYGSLNSEADISNLELSEPEFINCPLRGNCKSEGILCKQTKIEDFNYSNKEIRLWKLCTTELTNEAIAEKMNLPMGSFHKLKKQLYAKLNIQTKQTLAIKAMYFGLI